jgi:hypothetical protein
MEPRISSNADEIARRMQARTRAVIRELTAEAAPIATGLEAESKRILQEEIYNVPIPLLDSADRETDLSRVPEQLRAQVLRSRKFKRALSAEAPLRKKTTKGSAGKWQRSGNLKRRERAFRRGPVVYMENRANYAAARNALGTSKGRQIRSEGVRSVQWQNQAIKNLRPWILQRRRRALLRALKQ